MLRKLTVLAVFGLILLTAPLIPATGEETRIFLITDLNAEAFPDIQVSFRAVTPYGKTVAGLSLDDISLTEGDQSISTFQLIEHRDAPINILYVIDLGQHTNYNSFGLEHIRRAITFPFLNEYFQDDKDAVRLLARANDGQLPQTIALFNPSKDGGAFLSYVNSMSLNPSSGPSDALRGIEDALDEIASLDDLGNSSTSLVFLTHLLDTLSDGEATAIAEQLIVMAREMRIPIYTFQTRIGGEDANALLILSRETGGEYLRLRNGEDQREDFIRFFEGITNQRAHYTLVYRSTSSQSGNRKVAVGPAGLPPGEISSFMLFDVDLQPPTVKILSPAEATTITIEMLVAPNDETSFQPSTLSISAELTGWIDGFPRHIAQAALLVNEELVSSIEVEPTDTLFNFTWNIQDIEEEGLFSIPFKVHVVDELDMQAESDPVVVNLEVFAERTALQSCLEDPISSPCLTTFLLPLLIILALIVISAIVLFFFHRRQARKAIIQDSFGVPRHTALAPEKKIEPSGEVFAKLKVLEGPPQMQGLDLDIRDYATTLGRDPDLSMISFFPEGDTSISGKHCTLQLHTGIFNIMDNHSLNGTTLNDEVLEPDKPYELKDGDVIELGDLSVRGVKLGLTILKAAKGRIEADATLYGDHEEDPDESRPFDIDA